MGARTAGIDPQRALIRVLINPKKMKMKNTYNVAVIVGSLRKASLNRRIAHALAELAPAQLELEIVEIGHLPHYNQDADENPPAAFTEFRNRIKAADAVLFATPEYNRSVPGVLKNALDIGSRPYGESAWNGKPGSEISPAGRTKIASTSARTRDRARSSAT